MESEDTKEDNAECINPDSLNSTEEQKSGPANEVENLEQDTKSDDDDKRDEFRRRWKNRKIEKFQKRNETPLRDKVLPIILPANSQFRVTEKDVGITEFVGNHEGFNGVIKERYSDFHVNEIDPDGKIVHLTDLSCPVHEDVEEHQNTQEIDCTILPAETLEKLRQISESEDSDEKVEIDVTDMSKDQRRAIHDVVKKQFPHKLVSNTKERDNQKFLIIQRHENKNGGSSKRDNWPRGKGRYVHFVLYKENADTMEAVNLLAGRLRLRPNMISFAGTKDKRGKTTQKMCAFKTPPSRLMEAGRYLRCFRLGNFTYENHVMKLGELKGNHFKIVLRNVSGTSEQIDQAMTSFKEKGFINYYGLQRFGTTSIPTYHIGRALLQGKWEKAVELILRPRPGDKGELAEARYVWWETRNPQKAYGCLRYRRESIEGMLLCGLARCNRNDFVNALEAIPRNTRLMYLHAYQSYVWNTVVSRKIHEFGLKPMEGDFVIDEPLWEDQEDEIPEKKVAPRILTKDDLEESNLNKLVLPLPGYDIIYPNNVVKQWYDELLGEDQLTSELKQRVRKYSLGGAYRRLMCFPENFSWKIVKYSDPAKPLILSDWEVLNDEKLPEDYNEGKFTAVVLEFSLPSCVYATMALREIMKSDTSTQYQSSLNDYAKETNCTDRLEVGASVSAKRSFCSDNDAVVKKAKLEKEAQPEVSAQKDCDGQDSHAKSEDSVTDKVNSSIEVSETVDGGEVSKDQQVKIENLTDVT